MRRKIKKPTPGNVMTRALQPEVKPSPKPDAYDPDQLRRMLLDFKGDVARIARKLKTDSEELRAFVYGAPILRRALEEVLARGVDESLKVLFDGLSDEHYVNRLGAAKVFLKSRAAARRGFAAPQAELEIKGPSSGSLTLTWLPPAEPKREPEGPKLIEGEVERGE